MSFSLLPNKLDMRRVMSYTDARYMTARRWLLTLCDEGLLTYDGPPPDREAREKLIREALLKRFPDVRVTP